MELIDNRGDGRRPADVVDGRGQVFVYGRSGNQARFTLLGDPNIGLILMRVKVIISHGEREFPVVPVGIGRLHENQCKRGRRERVGGKLILYKREGLGNPRPVRSDLIQLAPAGEIPLIHRRIDVVRGVEVQHLVRVLADNGADGG